MTAGCTCLAPSLQGLTLQASTAQRLWQATLSVLTWDRAVPGRSSSAYSHTSVVPVLASSRKRTPHAASPPEVNASSTPQPPSSQPSPGSGILPRRGSLLTTSPHPSPPFLSSMAVFPSPSPLLPLSSSPMAIPQVVCHRTGMQTGKHHSQSKTGLPSGLCTPWHPSALSEVKVTGLKSHQTVTVVAPM